MQNAPLVSFSGERARFPIWMRAAGRYFITGTALRGAGDNATMFCHATVDYRARPYIRLTRRKWERLARRNAAVTVPAALSLAAVTPQVELWHVAAYESSLAVAGATYGAIRVHRAVVSRGLNKRYIDPAASTLYALMGMRYERSKARHAIHLRDGWTPGDPVTVTLPGNAPLTPSKETQLVRAIGGRLGIVGARGTWNKTGEHVTVAIVGQALPPTEVTLDMLQEAIDLAPAHAPVLGWGPEGPLSIDLTADSPHGALSGEAGTGKTTVLRFILAQRMSHGVGVIFLDAKRWSHRWAHKLPESRAQYWYRVPDMHNSLVAIGEELQRRIGCDEDELGSFRELDVVVEEINSLIKMLGAYWRGERRRIMNAAKVARRDGLDYDEADLDPPPLSPAVAALQFAVNMGRELQIHVWAAAQRLEANVFGSNSGAAVRQSFGIRLMAKWDPALWKMLAGGHTYVAWPGGPHGIWGFVQQGEFVMVRVPYVDMATAVAIATGGQDPTGFVLGQQEVDTVNRRRGQVDSLDNEDTPVAKEIEAPVRLAKILDMLPGQDGPEALSIGGLRTAAKRDGFPAVQAVDGRSYLYLASEVIAWRLAKLGRPE